MWALAAVCRVETVGFVAVFSVQEPHRNPQPHLNSQSIFFFFLTAPVVSTRRGAPQVHPDETVALRARCAPVFTSKRLKKHEECKNGPMRVSGWPVPPRAARCSSGLPPRSLSPVQLLSSNRLLTPISWQGRDVNADKRPIRHAPEKSPLTPSVHARWRSSASANGSADVCEKQGGHWQRWPMALHPPMGGVSSSDLSGVGKYYVWSVRNFSTPAGWNCTEWDLIFIKGWSNRMSAVGYDRSPINTQNVKVKCFTLTSFQIKSILF